MAPAATARSIMAIVASKSVNGYSWNQKLTPGTAPISSIGTIVLVDTIMIVPAAAAARAVASSPSGCAIFCEAMGATRIGRAIG